MFRPVIKWIAPVALAALLVGCSSDSDDRPTVRSGWLGNLSSFERVSGTKGNNTGVFVRRGGPAPAPLETIYLEPVDVTLAAGSNLETLEPSDIVELRALLTRSVRTALADAAVLAPRPGAGVYTMRVALTHLQIGRTQRLGGSDRRQHLRFSLGKAAIESELRDGATNMRRVATIAAALIRPDRKAPAIAWEALAPRFDEYAELLAAQIATARTALAIPPAAPAKK